MCKNVRNWICSKGAQSAIFRSWWSKPIWKRLSENSNNFAQFEQFEQFRTMSNNFEQFRRRYGFAKFQAAGAQRSFVLIVSAFETEDRGFESRVYIRCWEITRTYLHVRSLE
jgi:hypothetical protein